MKTLGLFRHAKSGWADPRARDFDRPLSERGERGAVLMGAHIRDFGVPFDRVLASPAVRVSETIELASKAFGRPQHGRYPPDTPSRTSGFPGALRCTPPPLL